MTTPTAFQQATVDVAVEALSSKKGKPRFLVADEVGLGKTVVAQRVIERLTKKKRGPLVVYYVCSSLTIAAQNARKLAEAVVHDNDTGEAICEADRLSMLPFSERPTHSRLHLYTLTPDTSLPGHSGRRRDGRRQERALIWRLADRCWPNLLPSDVFQRNAFSSWEQSLEDAEKKLARSGTLQLIDLQHLFKKKLRKLFGLSPGQHFPAALKHQCQEDGEYDDLKLISRCRTALVECTLEMEDLKPDLVILDEFQRYRYMVEPKIGLDGKPREADSAHAVLEQLRGDRARRIPVLLLSATPYSLYNRQDDEQLFGAHHDQLLELLCFLYGDGQTGYQRASEIKALFARFSACLRSEPLDFSAMEELKRHIEDRLTRVMSRTERMRLAPAIPPGGESKSSPEAIPVDTYTDDWRIFRHLSERFPQCHCASAIDYWRSVPLPMQTMGNSYVAWAAANQSRQATRLKPPSFTLEHWQGHKRVKWPHGKLRALASRISASNLVLPWSAPSMPWWKLDSRWQATTQNPGKLLLFSRFRATPRSVAAALSHEARVHATKIGKLTGGSTQHLMIRADRMTPVALFHPALWMAECCEPLTARGKQRSQIVDEMRQSLRGRLAQAGVTVRGDSRRRQTWRLLAALDRKLAPADSESSIAGVRTAEVKAVWKAAAEQPIGYVSDQELEDLAWHALSAPGVVLTRALLRHDRDGVTDNLAQLSTLSLRYWRNYFDNPVFVAALRKKLMTYPRALKEAVFLGNLESVLDEHLWYLGRSGINGTPAVLNEMEQALRLKGGRVAIHDPNSSEILFRAQCDVAIPLGQELEPTGPEEGKARPIRADQVRKAFNSPFWPLVLTTTSVGQEGLDFHPWCRTLLHWDLPGNPVDLEQREGRIQRYAGLGVRRQLAKDLGRDALRGLASGESPWCRLAARVSAEYTGRGSGFQPWWHYPGASVDSLFFHLRSSDEECRLEVLKQQRSVYRLTLGQQHQEDFVRMVVAKDAETIQRLAELTPDLSAWSRMTRERKTREMDRQNADLAVQEPDKAVSGQGRR